MTTRLPVRLVRLGEEDTARRRGAIASPGSPVATGLEPVLAAHLRRLESRLDRLLVHFGLIDNLPLRSDEAVPLTLSGSGLRTQGAGATSSFEVGDCVAVDLLLPEAEPRLVEALGRVVSPMRGGSSDVAVEFTSIDEFDRDAIIRHAYDVQRFYLRAQTEAERTS